MKNENLTTNLTNATNFYSEIPGCSCWFVLVRGKILLLTLLIAHCSLLICTCDLFNAEMQPDFQNKIDEEIRWSNAERLTVRVDYPSEWGSSPQQGALSKDNTRKGYAFDVEFTSLPGFGFEEWLAFYTEDYNKLNMTKSANDDEVKGFSLNGNGVEISRVNAAGTTAKITINISKAVTLVPWCSDRPRLSPRCNPPLNQTMTEFPYDQQVILWFNMTVNKNDMEEFGENRIVITGYDRILGQPVEGDLNEYFTLEYSNPDPLDPALVNTVTLVPIPEKANVLANLIISVKVGPDIKNKDGIAMAQAETVSYQTNASQMQKGYRASDITVTRPDGTPFFADSEIYLWRDPNIDRRFIKDANVPLSFSVSLPRDVTSPPNKITIIELMAYKLDGSPFNNIDIPEETIHTEFSYGTTCTITHKLKSNVSGIIQLLVLPWNDGETPSIPPLAPDVAVSESRYVTIVLDIAAPGVADLGASLSNESSRDETGVYVYGSGRAMTLTVGGLGSLADNGSQGGIPVEQARGLPWTMDDARNLFWYAAIGYESGGTITIAKTSGKVNVYDGFGLKNTWTPDDITHLTESDVYQVYVQFEDSLDNVSGWIDTRLRVKFNAAINPVTELRAECDEEGTSIEVTWKEPNEFLYPEIVIRTHRASESGDIFESETQWALSKSGSDTKKGTYLLSVNPINSDSVRDGNAVSGVYGYEIEVIAYNTTGTVKTGPIWVYNIPGMDSNIIRIEDNEQVTSDEQLGKNIVLTSDITISNHTPIGDNSTNNNNSRFTGKFYGNGHTITINSFNTPYNTYTGLFGYISGNALIRDLTVVYDASISNSTIQYLGGITGYAAGTADIRNIITSGSLNVELTNTAVKYIGGITGYMGEMISIDPPEEKCDVTITNIRAGVNLTATATGTNDVFFGGITGDTATGGTGDLAIDKVNVTGALTHNQTGGVMYTGGVAGRFRANLSVGEYKADLSVSSIEFSGTLSAVKTGDGRTYVGGICGYTSAGTFSNCLMSGPIDIPVEHTSNSRIDLGGLCGHFNNSTIRYSRVTSNISCKRQGTGASDEDPNALYSGGLSGDVTNCTVDNFWYEQGSIILESKSRINVGGVAGGTGGTTYTNCGSLASLISAEISTGTSIPYTIRATGFIGIMNGTTLTGCYTRTDIIARSKTADSSVIYAGGLIGHASANASFSKCYTTGNVVVETRGSADIYAGGLIGRYDGGASYSVNNSYALGNVSADRTSGTGATYAGGLVGYFSTSGGVVQTNGIYNCFTGGNVSAKSNGSGAINSGGIVGYFTVSGAAAGTTNLRNNAALGDSVTGMGSGSRAIGRIYGDLGGTSHTPANNYVKDTMRIELGNYDTVYFPLRVGSATPPYYTTTPDAHTRHGTVAAVSAFYNRDFWTTTTQLGFLSANWNFSTVIGRGYPTLKDVGGQ